MQNQVQIFAAPMQLRFELLHLSGELPSNHARRHRDRQMHYLSETKRDNNDLVTAGVLRSSGSCCSLLA